MARPSGIAVVPDEKTPVLVAVASVEVRGRFNILPRWRNRVSWLASATTDVEALMTFREPGLIRLSEWAKDGPTIEARFAELSNSVEAEAVEALRLIQDRYNRLRIPWKERASLGDAALAHLGVGTAKNERSIVYVSIFETSIDVMSVEFRNQRLLEGSPLIDDLP